MGSQIHAFRMYTPLVFQNDVVFKFNISETFPFFTMEKLGTRSGDPTCPKTGTPYLLGGYRKG